MHAWWPLVAGAALFAVVALVFLRRSARSRPSGKPSPRAPEPSAPGRRLTSPADERPRRARHRLDETHPFARYPVARQRPTPHPRPADRRGADQEQIQRFRR
ncbi:hypothetical protein [Amycolatopsis jiangsuensis]|uniref:Uncharacterized protein n=1 Tax=Amycolatopsis jiangsuensis TaxID=1181879 RepID=A0A840J4X8_9PSEU|nr:hypothetical protein [Amycolatopsis jiangsuensis]MBB4688675.1 hypothetical protein [Amycolatopsis jiangsuensis]